MSLDDGIVSALFRTESNATLLYQGATQWMKVFASMRICHDSNFGNVLELKPFTRARPAARVWLGTQVLAWLLLCQCL